MTRAPRGVTGTGGPRVALFGEVGVGNLGNDASFAACARLLRERVPGARIAAMGRDVGLAGAGSVAGVEGIHGYDDAVPLGSALGLRLRRSGRTGPVARTLSKLADLGHLVRVVGDFDAVVVPGTGVLEREHRRGPGGVLVWLVLLAVACRVRGVPLAWFAIGGSSYASRWPAWTAGLAARGARHRTFRDVETRDALPAWSAAADDVVTHDVVLGRDEAVAGDAPPGRPAGVRTVAVGVIDHDPPGPSGAELRRRYVARVAGLVRMLTRTGFAVELVSADRADREAVAAVLAALDEGRDDAPAVGTGGGAAPQDLAPVTVVPAEEGDLDALIARLAAADVVVASRYHVLVAAALARRPVVALSHADKDGALLRRAGLERYLVPIDDLEPERIAGLVSAAHADGERVAGLLDALCRAGHASVHAEADRLVDVLGLAPGGRAGGRARDLAREAS
ncbi:polysaccharide pyruvyl transferase family protein [Isoptericola sp. 4D.3]|uniref:Polysaccharide pyruvyl transferase family protein n=1 Tax=Isoptericola peretonis TaxID=2918523 RepID=A0ABT0J5Q6_9MICO|nr:polysaccharide pyruvyl transferase family protein [Isoptericola sp. 4D.3]